MGGNAPGLEQGSTTGDAAGDETTRATEVRAATNQCCETETTQQDALNVLSEELKKNENETTENYARLTIQRHFQDQQTRQVIVAIHLRNH